MSIEGQFRRLPVQAAPRQLAFAGHRAGKGYLDDIRRFEMLERDRARFAAAAAQAKIPTTAQRLIARIRTPLTVLKVHEPSLEEAYVELLRQPEEAVA